MTPLRVLVNARWENGWGYSIVITASPDPEHVLLATIDGTCLVNTTPLHATVEEAVEYCNAMFLPCGPLMSVLEPITTITDLMALSFLADAEARHAAHTLTMPRRSMS